MKETTAKTNTGKRCKLKRIWSKEQLSELRVLSEDLWIHTLLQWTIDDMMDKRDLHGALHFLKGFDEDNNDVYHWPMVQLCLIHGLLNDQEKALKIITDVLYLYDGCQYAQFYFARVLFARGQRNDAIEIWEKIVKKGAVKIAHAKCACSEGFEWAEHLVADCKCSLGLAYASEGRESEAVYWLGQYEQDRQRGRSGLLDWGDDEE